MKSVIRLPDPMKLYYSDRVYSPEYTSVETILIADKLIKDGKKPFTTVLDVGCGSGILGLGIKKLNPGSVVTLADVDPEAVRVARLNSKRLGLAAQVVKADLLPVLGQWDIICANLPTYSEEDMRQDLHGPVVAYFAGEPLSLYSRLFDAAVGRGKALVCECQKKYQDDFLAMAKERGWELILHTEMSFAFICKEP